ncbi:unnamed protein product [Callosobruchus maculatus]|uniref:Uncharacterized protein n=1 Tax=Callosobruchus maculatus TaxID=64391 RepID=A0A653DK65_CALMS|nr:unnamed protein product [Callosobruchus maculatus]
MQPSFCPATESGLDRIQSQPTQEGFMWILRRRVMISTNGNVGRGNCRESNVTEKGWRKKECDPPPHHLWSIILIMKPQLWLRRSNRMRRSLKLFRL